MTFIRDSDSEVLRDDELLEMGSFVSVLSRFALRGTRVTAVIRSLGQYSKTSDFSYALSSLQARIADIARELVSSGLVRVGVKSCSHSHAGGTI